MKRTIKFTLYRERIATQADLDAEAAYVEEHGNANYGEDLKLGEPMDFEDEIELPATWDICSRCDGEGSHVNPSIDGNGISAEEFMGPDWDDDEREMYFSGGYDVACEAGCTNGKVLVPDEDACTQEPLKTLLETYLQKQDDDAREAYADSRMRFWENGGQY